METVMPRKQYYTKYSRTGKMGVGVGGWGGEEREDSKECKFRK